MIGLPTLEEIGIQIIYSKQELRNKTNTFI